MFAVIEISGKQHLVSKGDKLTVDTIEAAAGSSLTINRVLLMVDGQTVKVGQPIISGVTVEAKVLRHFRDQKVTVLKYKPKVRYRKKYGHRQSKTEIEITKLPA